MIDGTCDPDRPCLPDGCRAERYPARRLFLRRMPMPGRSGDVAHGQERQDDERRDKALVLRKACHRGTDPGSNQVRTRPWQQQSYDDRRDSARRPEEVGIATHSICPTQAEADETDHCGCREGDDSWDSSCIVLDDRNDPACSRSKGASVEHCRHDHGQPEIDVACRREAQCAARRHKRRVVRIGERVCGVREVTEERAVPPVDEERMQRPDRVPVVGNDRCTEGLQGPEHGQRDDNDRDEGPW